MTKEIVAYNATKAALADLTARYQGLVFEVTTSKGMADAKAAYKEINTHSITLENARKREKAESLEYGRFVDSEAKRIDDQLEAIRLPIKAQIETETKREEREREAKIAAEAERIAAEERARKEAEEAKMRAERAEIARRQAELDRAAAAQAQADREARLKIELEERAARMKIEEENRKAREAREAADREAAKLRAAEEGRIKAERDKLYAEAKAIEEKKRAEQEAIEAKAKVKREAEEAKQRKIWLAAQELADGAQILRNFLQKFGTRAEFAKVCDAIHDYLAASGLESPATRTEGPRPSAAGPT